MQKEESSCEDNFYTTTAAAAFAVAVEETGGDENSFIVDDLSANPFLSPNDHSLFNFSLFSQPSTTSSEGSIEDSDVIATERRLHHASYTLQYQQLYNRYTLCLNHLQESIKELDSLRLENADLAQRLRLLSQATIQNCLSIGAKSSSIVRDSHVAAFSDPPPLNHNRLERQNHEQFPLPKSISVRSSGYLKLRPKNVSKGNSASHNSTRNRVNNSVPGSEVVHLPQGQREEEAFAFEAYNQGVFKTELCNKWEETGACPYGDNCQYAHGITELRPVIRHPRYKTQVCRMVMAGDVCPYGHRCHFRHSLTQQERLVAFPAQR